MEFGVPRRREAGVNKEKYEGIAVLTASEFKGKGTGRTLSLNAKAIEGLGIDFSKDAMISFSFNGIEKSVVIANTSGLEGVSGVRIAKTSKSVSDKPYFEAIKANFEIKVEDAVEFLLTKTENEFNGNPTFFLSVITSVDKMNETVKEAVAETEIDANEVPLEAIIEQAEIRDEALAAEVAEIELDIATEAGFGAGDDFAPTVEITQPAVAEVAVETEAEQAKNFFAGFDE